MSFFLDLLLDILKLNNNEVEDTYKFHSRIQQPNESFDDFLADIKELVKTCNYGLLENRMLRDKIVSGISDERLREVLIATKNLDLNEAIRIAKNWKFPVRATIVNRRTSSVDYCLQPSPQSIGLSETLCKLNKFIMLQKEERELYVKDYEAVRNYMTQKMQEADEVFKRFYNGPVLAGSYADNVRVSKPDEFDLVLHMKLPDHSMIQVIPDEKRPGYVNINVAKVMSKIEKEVHNKKVYDRLQKLVDEEKFLLQNKVQAWIEGIVTKVMSESRGTFTERLRLYEFDYRKCGPAHTLTVRVCGNEFSIDFVPAFMFDKSTWTAQRKCPPCAKTSNWIAVPKPVKGHNGPNRAFITSYVDIERDLIRNKNTLKNTLRMLKKLRDRHGIENLKSYFIKTVFLLEDAVQPAHFWDQPTDFVLIHMFNKLIERVESKNLPFFWDSRDNMFKNYTESQMNNMLGQLKKNLKELVVNQSNPDKVFAIFCTPGEIHKMKSTVEQKSLPEVTLDEVTRKMMNLMNDRDSIIPMCDHRVVTSTGYERGWGRRD